MSDIRWRLTPLDESGLVYFGLDITNGNQAAVFVEKDHASRIFRDEHKDYVELEFAHIVESIGISFCNYSGDLPDVTTINDREYWIYVWDKRFDEALVSIIDRLTHMRMMNATAVSLKLQLEMPL